jgi:hypothetical protein
VIDIAWELSGHRMATFALIHGAADVGWYWHLVEADLRRLGHDTIAPDLPVEDDGPGSRPTRMSWSMRSGIALMW